jgi:hypothetical protein
MQNQNGGMLLKIIFTTLLLIIVVLVGGGIYLYITFKPLLAEMQFQRSSAVVKSETSTTPDKHPLLTDSQEKTLELVGIDPAKLPTKLTPELEACAVEKLGVERVADIIKGALPSMMDLLKAKSCLE